MKLDWNKLAWLAVGLFAGVIISVSLFYFLRQSRPAAIYITPPAPQPTAQPTETPSPIKVYVSGEVISVDVYELPAGSIVQDAITAAGGFTEQADSEVVNLALPLNNGMQISVPAFDAESEIPVITRGETIDPGLGPVLININEATLIELESLPGIGPGLGQRIIDYRQANGPFAAIEDLTSVNGIGPSTYEQLKDLITVN